MFSVNSIVLIFDGLAIQRLEVSSHNKSHILAFKIEIIMPFELSGIVFYVVSLNNRYMIYL